MFGGAHVAAAAGGDPGVGIGRRQRAAVRRPAADRAAARAGSALRARHGVRRTCARSSRNFVPVFVSRGVVQLSGYIDTLLATLLPTGAVAGADERADALHAAGQPVRHVGVGGGTAGDVGRGRARSATAREALRSRLDAGLRQIAFFVVPSAMAFLALGDVVAGGAAPDRPVQPRRRALRVGRSWPARRSACWRRRSAACTRRPTTRCATRGRRCATRSSASR